MIDTQLERSTVAAILAYPERLASVDDLAVSDLADYPSIATMAAIRNLQAREAPISVDAVRVELLATDHPAVYPTPEGWPDNWYDALVAAEPVTDLPLAAEQIRQLADFRRMAVDAAEVEVQAAKRRRKPTGPRADNVEPVRLAEAFARYAYTQDDDITLIRWARAWWRYDGTRYVEHDDEDLDRDLIGFLDIVVTPVQVRVKNEHGQVVDTRTDLQRVTSKSKTISEVRKACLHACPSVGRVAPAWTHPTADDPPPVSLIAVQNGLLDLRDSTLYPPTPRFFVTTASNAAWDPKAPPPATWLAFLDSLWGADTEAIRGLQQMFGYFLTTDTSYQKLFALIGPPRSGKGTIARILKALLGDDAVVNPTLKSLAGERFGLAPIVGKTLAVIGDARLGGPTDQSYVVEVLLSLSGEDSLSVDRKNRDAINVRPVCRVLLLSNELPRLYDTSGALASRFVILCLSKSFLGSEDTQLERKLLAELSGILRWAVEGLEDLSEQGKFARPASSDEAFAHLREISSPHSVFFEECCEFSAAEKTDVDDLYARFKTWCEASGREPENKQMFGRNLHTLFPEIRCAQYRVPSSGKHRRAYFGIRLIA